VRALWLARHGQSISNARRQFLGSRDVPLSDLGRRQAARLGDALSARKPAHVYASPFDRARSTAEIAIAGLDVPVTLVDDLRELSLGEWEGCTVDEVSALPGDAYTRWVRDPVNHCPPGSEPLDALQARALRAVAAISAAHPDGEDVLVVSHGGFISAYLAHCLGLSLSDIWRLTVSNASLTRVVPPHRVLSLNETDHLVGLEGATGGREP
jgi:broad specificity phosphatase PhoE